MSDVSNKQSTAINQLKALFSGVLWDCFNDKSVVEIMVNPDGAIYVERLGKDIENVGTINPSKTELIIKMVAGFHNEVVTRDHPICQGEFPIDFSRFEGMIPPIVEGPSFTLRKKAIMVFSLDDYVKNGVMSENQKNTICKAVTERKNILVVGGTGSGKTTLINAIIQEMVDQNAEERVVIIEDTNELQCTAKNHVQMRTSPTVSMTDLLKATLRYRPDRILVGEVRGAEALDLLDAWCTGHPGGCATVHSDTAERGLRRLGMLVTRNREAPPKVELLIGEAVQMVVNIVKDPINHKRYIRSIIEVEDYDELNHKYNIITVS